MKKMRWFGHVAQIGTASSCAEFFVISPYESVHDRVIFERD